MKRFGMVKHLLLCVLLVSAVSHRVQSEMFTERGVVDIPTGNILSHGNFGAGVFIGYPRFEHNSARYRCDAVAFRFNFGVFDRVEVGLRYLSNSEGRPSAVRSANLKIQLLKEQESERFPSVAIGVENLSDRKVYVPDPTHGRIVEVGIYHPADYEPDPAPSTFLAISKTLRRQYSVHLGVASGGESRMFVGLSKEFQPAFARGDITINFEANGELINTGIYYAMSSGLQIALGIANVSYPQRLRYLAAVSWSNE